jgi:hypothetical protein
MAEEIARTIEDLEQIFYGSLGQQYVQKTDYGTGTVGVYNATYGSACWAQLNTEANAFGIMPKYPWQRSGWRVITARPSHTTYGVAEGGAIPDGVVFTHAELSTKPKQTVTPFNATDIQHYLASESLDDVFGAMEQLRPIFAVDHAEAINEALLKTNDTVASNNFESLDRVCSSKSEIDGGGVGTNTDCDIYGISRDGSTTYDAYVSHNSTVARALTDELIRTVLNGIGNQGGYTKTIVTGWDTYSKTLGLYDTYVRYTNIGEAKANFSVNGINTAVGTEVGITIPTLYRVPLIVSKNTTQDTISRMLFLDTSDPEGFGFPRLGIGITRPTQYFEEGMNTGHPFAVGYLTTRGIYVTSGELICRNFKSQGKLRDLL